jgi:hypothetical protein
MDIGDTAGTWNGAQRSRWALGILLLTASEPLEAYVYGSETCN